MKNNKLFFCTALFVLLFGGASGAFVAAQTMADGSALQIALSSAAPGDIIKLRAGVTYYPGTSANAVFTVNKDITISGGWSTDGLTQNLVAPSILSGDYNADGDNYYPANPSLVLGDNADQVIVWGGNAQGKIEGVRITGGGGAANNNATGLTIQSGNLTIKHTAFDLNKRALYAGAGTVLTVDSCTFTQNYSGTFGTVVTLMGAVNAVITNSVFENNGAAHSPIYLNNGAQLTVSHSTFNNNIITLQGGAVIGVNGNTSAAKIAFSTFANNTRKGLGNAGDISAVLAYKGKVDVYHCTFIGNVVQGEVLYAKESIGVGITYGGNVFLGNTTNAAGTQLAYVNDNALVNGVYLDDAGYNMFNAGGGSFIGIGGDNEEITSPVTDYFAGSYAAGSLYSPAISTMEGYTPVILPAGTNKEDLIIVPKDLTTSWMAAVWGAATPLTDQRNVKMAPVYNKYYAGAVNLDACPDVALWTAGGADNDWNNYLNWTCEIGGAPAGGVIPGPCTYVTIPYGTAEYPVLTAATDAECDIIYFEHGGEVAGTPFLAYNSAKVDLTLTPERWYMISVPLRDMYSGDFLLGESTARRNPAVELARYQAVHPDVGTSSEEHIEGGTDTSKDGGKWSGSFSSMTERLSINRGIAIAAKINLNDLASGDPNHKPAYTFEFPRSETKYQYYYASGAPTGVYTETMDKTNGGKFIYESIAGYKSGTFALPIENGTEATYPRVIVGNPFMAHLDLTDFYNENSGELSGIFNLSNPNGGGVETYSLSGGVVISTDPATGDRVTIAPMQSVLAERKTGESFSELTFDTDMTRIDTSTPLRAKAATASSPFEGRLNINVSRDGQRESGAVLLYKQGSDNGYVQGEDAKIFVITNMENKPAVVYTVAGGEAMAINTLGDLSNDIALGISTSVKGLLTMDFTGMESFGRSKVILLDLEAGIEQNLEENPSYTFDNTVGNVEGRFFLRMASNEVEDLDGGLIDRSIINVYSDNGTVYVNSNSPIAQISITDIKGQLLYKTANTGGVYTLNIPLNITSQVVLVQVETEMAKEMKKVLVK